MLSRHVPTNNVDVRILVTGTAGHLGEALARTLEAHEVIGVDIVSSPFTSHIGSISDRAFVHECMRGVDAVLHAATLHKPHVATHTKQQFIDANITGTCHLLEEAVAARVGAFVFTSTTSAFGRALSPAPDEPAAWITEQTADIPKNIYGVSKTAAEDLCELFHREHDLAVLVLRTSRFFPEEDDDKDARENYSSANAKVNELLYRRADLEDVVSAHVRAIEHAARLRFGKYIVSATTPFVREQVAELRADAPALVACLFPEHVHEYARRGWTMLPGLDRVYDNTKARRDLGWEPRFDYGYALERMKLDEPLQSALAIAVGSKGYHAESFATGPYPVEAETSR